MKQVDITELLPHEGKMVLLDSVVAYDRQSLISETCVRDDGLFGDGETIPAWIGIEYMAQTVAAHGGMMQYLANKPITPGFLLGTRRYISNISHFSVGAQLTITAEKIIEDMGMSVFFCQITGNGIDLSAKINVYLPDMVENNPRKIS